MLLELVKELRLDFMRMRAARDNALIASNRFDATALLEGMTQRLTEYENLCWPPLSDSDIAKGRDQAANAWKEVFGDQRDPKVAAMIEATAESLRQADLGRRGTDAGSPRVPVRPIHG